jgi:hypothetical protein
MSTYSRFLVRNNPISKYTNLIFWGLYFVIYSYNKNQQDALFLKLTLIYNSTCFGQTYCPSSEVLILYSQQLVFVILVMLTVSISLADGQNNQYNKYQLLEYSTSSPDDRQKVCPKLVQLNIKISLSNSASCCLLLWKGKGLPQQVAQGVPGRLRPRIFLTFGITRVVGRQPYAPAAFTPGEITGIHFKRLSRPQGTWFSR